MYCYGNVNELGDVGGSPGKSSLFFLTVKRLENSLTGEKAYWLAKHVSSGVSGALLTVRENPREVYCLCDWSYS